MSYCRFSDSNVYMYADASRFCIVCMSCRLKPTGHKLPEFDDHYFYCSKDAIDHLKEHKQAGHKVPKRAIDRLYAEQVNTDNWILRHYKATGGKR